MFEVVLPMRSTTRYKNFATRLNPSFQFRRAIPKTGRPAQFRRTVSISLLTFRNGKSCREYNSRARSETEMENAR